MALMLSGCAYNNDSYIYGLLNRSGIKAEQQPRGVVIFLDGITFLSGEDTVGDEGYQQICDVVDIIKKKSLDHKLVYFEGHTDSEGDGSYNYDLGRRRAEYIRDIFLSLGLNMERTMVESHGEEFLISTDHNKNRRVDVVLINKTRLRSVP